MDTGRCTGAANVLAMKSSTPPHEHLWSVPDVAAYLGVPVATIYRWRHHGIGPPGHRVGRHIRFDPDDVRTWFKNRTRG